MSNDSSIADSVSSFLNIAAILTLIAGLGIGLYALSGPLGVWFGLWTFRSGFDVLRVVNTYSDWIAGVGFLVTIIAFTGAKLIDLGNSSKLASLALVGTIAAALAYFVPESFRAPEGTPGIHDITTNTANPPIYVAIAPLRADAPNSMDYGAGNNMTPERLAGLQHEAFPEIVPQRFNEPVDQVFDRALEAVETLGWELVAAVPQEGRIEATDTTFWFRFKDDVVIYITRENNETVLNARSLSRVGGGDLGKNAARLREFFALL